MTQYDQSVNDNLKPRQNNSMGLSIDEMAQPMNESILNLDNLIYQKINIPFTRKVIIDERELTEQLDEIRRNIPDCIQQSMDIIEDRNNIIQEAQQYASQLVNNAKREAAQRLDESLLVQQEQFQANQLRRKVFQECEDKRRQTEKEIEKMVESAEIKARKILEKSIMEAEKIHTQADDFVDQQLYSLEKELTKLLKTVITLSNYRQGEAQAQENNQGHNNGKNQGSLTDKKAS
ncbi:hypothetical protein IQ215_06400 [Cyanobacterium stanieri LEGE 03274]|uniref:Vacuolar-type H+-ATPase subunit H n=1 Tax=Cyanobacterium stanieri LEGE 03274 TaxID=1828756 RepID=A0ABR9V449_9CHRO|nr:hypothetical protein [Cyanobacterium stanieri]MBE9222324.1 hypothetical protein [Cyanobacterium stanieri LEGE 03274]